MKLLKKVIDTQINFIKSRPALKKFMPLMEAMDNFFFGPGETTKFAPHIMDRMDIKRFMTFVVIALLPSTIGGIYFYGLRIITMIVVSYAVGGIIEVAFAVGRRKQIHEGFLVTGLIFPLILPPTIPLWMLAVGVAFGVFFGKEVFGGTGKNIFNPALVGRVFLSVAFPEYFASKWAAPIAKVWGGFVQYSTDALTAATPLIDFKSTQLMANYSDLLFGYAPGSVGETIRIGIIAGGLLLIIVRIVDWRIPISYLLSVAFFALVLNHFAPGKFAPPMFQLLSGGLLFGAFFMASDPVTAPLNFGAKWIYGLLLGVLTVLIRGISGFVEGVMFAILLMNGLAPLLDNLVVNFRFKKAKESEA